MQKSGESKTQRDAFGYSTFSVYDEGGSQYDQPSSGVEDTNSASRYTPSMPKQSQTFPQACNLNLQTILTWKTPLNSINPMRDINPKQTAKITIRRRSRALRLPHSHLPVHRSRRYEDNRSLDFIQTTNRTEPLLNEVCTVVDLPALTTVEGEDHLSS